MVATYDRHTCIVTKRLRLLSFGGGEHGQLGHGNGDDIMSPKEVEADVASVLKQYLSDGGVEVSEARRADVQDRLSKLSMMVTQIPRLSLACLRELRLELDTWQSLLRDGSRREGDEHAASAAETSPTRPLRAQRPTGADSSVRAEEAAAAGERAQRAVRSHDGGFLGLVEWQSEGRRFRRHGRGS